VQLTWCEPGDAAPLSLVHPPDWLDIIRERAARGEDAGEEVPMVPASWPAILAATSALLTATDHAIDNRACAFAAVRPPGHHASARRAMGFCPVNLVAVAVMHARERGLERALVIDWDVHHGNGTQDIVAGDPLVRFVSMHQVDWYPGTGTASDDGGGNCRNLPMQPGLPRSEYVEVLWSAIDVITRDFAPDVVFISAGYDSMAGDPLGGFTLEPEDYATWVSRLLDRWQDTPLVGSLEGGYAPTRLAEGVAATVRAMG
jgi:acetoin utilization deacetylase AcuC-like enzyme